MKIEVKKAEGKITLENLKLYLYGPSKIGRSTFASRFKNPIFLASDTGYKRVTMKNGAKLEYIEIPSWEIFIEAIKLLGQSKMQEKYKTIVIDDIDKIYRHCQTFACNKMKVEHPSDEEYGKGYDILRAYFEKVIFAMSYLPYSFIFISGAKDEIVTTRSIKITKTVSTLANQAKGIILPLCDIIVYCCMRTFESKGEYKERRVIIFEPSENLETGYGGDIKLPPFIPLNYSSFEQLFKREG